MRTSQQLQAKIDKLQKILKGKDMEKYNLKQRIESLQHTLSKAQHREELEADGVYVNIVSVERHVDSIYSGYRIKTDEGLHWLTHKHLKTGKHKVTRRFRDRVKEINEEFRNREPN